MYSISQFYTDLEQYINMYEKGLKKIANKLIAESMLKFDTLSEQDKNTIVVTLCKDFFDDKQNFYTLFNRGNGSIPYELSKRVEPILKSFCDNDTMPQMRWYYQLFRDTDILEKAYNNPHCDAETVDLYFNRVVEWLYWGAHHFPEGCLIDYDGYTNTLAMGEQIINQHNVSQNLIDDFLYYKRLYEIWWEYSKSDKSRDFQTMCEEDSLGFSEIITVYYDK